MSNSISSGSRSTISTVGLHSVHCPCCKQSSVGFFLLIRGIPRGNICTACRLEISMRRLDLALSSQLPFNSWLFAAGCILHRPRSQDSLSIFLSLFHSLFLLTSDYRGRHSLGGGGQVYFRSRGAKFTHFRLG